MHIKKLFTGLIVLFSIVSLRGAQVTIAADHIPQTYVIIEGKTARGRKMFFAAQSIKNKEIFFAKTSHGQTKEDLVQRMGVSLKDGSFDKVSINGLGDTLHVFNVGRKRIKPRSVSDKITMKWISVEDGLDNLVSLIHSGLGFLAGGSFSACNGELIYKVFYPQGYGSIGALDRSEGATCVNPRPWEK